MLQTFALPTLALALTAAIAAAEKPNVIYVLADDLGIGDLGCYGQKIIETPQLDRMAAEGLRFTQHYSGSNVCAPTRCSLMTGLHTGHTFIRGNAQNPDGPGQLPIPDSAFTLAELMKKAGYATAMFGKWGLGEPDTTGDPLTQGWDLYVGYTDQVRAHNYFPDFILKNGERVPLDNEVVYLPKTEWHKGTGSYSTGQHTYSHDVLEQDALDFIRAHRDQPFFLYLPFALPHDNGEAPELKMEVPDFGRYADKDWPINMKGYAEMVTRLDATVGRVLDLLAELDLDDHTLVIFTSDNGSYPHQKDPNLEITEFFDSNGPYRGTKRDMTEGGIRAPMLAWWPGTIAASGTTDHVSAHWDVMPTLADLSGAEIEGKTDGLSLVPTLRGETSAQAKHDHLYWEDGEDGDVGIREGRWKGILRGLHKNPDAKFEIYDLEADVGETTDLAAEKPELVARFHQLVREARTPSEEFPLTLPNP